MTDLPDYTKYTGNYVGGQAYENRKPVMSEDKRKVLNMLEFIMETCPWQRVCQIVVNSVPQEVLERVNNDLFYIPDADMAEYLHEYADLVKKNKDREEESRRQDEV
jgi:hypothetical protein